jgi:soluble lytic murein transglycosylase-like protein
MPHHPTQLRVRALGQGPGERVLVGWGVEADLDQLVVAQRGQGRIDHGVGHARVADLYERVKRVGLGAQEAALEAGEAAARFFAHAAHSKEGRGPSRLHVAVVAFVLWFGVACATTAPPVPMSFAPTPRETALPDSRLPFSLTAAVPISEPAPLLDQAPPESASLLYVRSVLERKGAKLDAVQREGVARAVVRAEAEHGLSVLMTLSLIAQESRFDPRAKGPTGSLGLMQLQPITAREVARQHDLAWQSDRTLFDPVQNVRIGLAYLAELRARFGSTDHAMAAYNIGPGALTKLLRKRPLRHGPYLKKVHAHAETMRQEFGHPETAIGG